MNTTQELQFLKLGGSLITDKHTPGTPRKGVIMRIAREIAAFRAAFPTSPLLLGHGSGSFGHPPAHRYGTRQGVKTREEWQGFAEVWHQASALNHLVMDGLQAAGVPALALPPSSAVTARNGRIQRWNLGPLQTLLKKGLLPVIYGDVVIDEALGGTILSTEDLFGYLGQKLSPARILIAGIEPGVWADYPACTRLIDELRPGDLKDLLSALSDSEAVDVTGGMASKVQGMMHLAQAVPGLKIHIFSGQEPDAIHQALLGTPSGTCIQAPKPHI